MNLRVSSHLAVTRRVSSTQTIPRASREICMILAEKNAAVSRTMPSVAESVILAILPLPFITCGSSYRCIR